ncbi:MULTISPECIES: transglutaminase family protein [Cyanophyceae]|uniref:transglutaminase-like domain-containing protein n=1 Tax=Cyanophyceae TaxID=3028117 RepID=UPI001686EADB|nr:MULTISPECIES: transglutaminase family protein [Cyanophyceae]MBD1918222.1 transglutaminase family protein [Phormidium sp. FACHB-77]MBD2030254.1 transglutaminase family protein [Phormidium sp. FACHB-322]MBD2051374.1 transglutaminase family protein [Leptolyngbya sp. FACHB-60]
MSIALPIALIPEAACLVDYQLPSALVDSEHPAIATLARSLTAATPSPMAQVKIVYEWVRDRIAHTYDIQAELVTCTASEVLAQGHGFCFAKAHLLAALLRHCGIPTGFCYQRLVFDDAQPTHHTLHGLNAVYLSELDRWVRLDARGNKPGVQADFNGDDHREQLAFPIRPHLGEVDYPTIYAQPHPLVITALQTHPTAANLIAHLPTSL